MEPLKSESRRLNTNEKVSVWLVRSKGLNTGGKRSVLFTNEASETRYSKRPAIVSAAVRGEEGACGLAQPLQTLDPLLLLQEDTII